MKRSLTLLISTASAVTVVASSLPSLAIASPHHGPGFFHRPEIGWHRPPPVIHHPIPRPHYRSWHTRDYAWLWAPLVTGAVIYGLTKPSESTPPTRTMEQPPTTANPSAKQATTLYWCEAEQGWWPTVRACPTGWKAMPAP